MLLFLLFFFGGGWGSCRVSTITHERLQVTLDLSVLELGQICMNGVTGWDTSIIPPWFDKLHHFKKGNKDCSEGQFRQNSILHYIVLMGCPIQVDKIRDKTNNVKKCSDVKVEELKKSTKSISNSHHVGRDKENICRMLNVCTVPLQTDIVLHGAVSFWTTDSTCTSAWAVQ